uniref:NADH dehydrogenase subunit 2 n=1 Tax=Leptomastidea bifasciata TaxID=1880993 RepID=UPI002E764798|nr:NADH dehydrogenase subunit 2 [Leptomastidea bifasciata]WPT46954.1 NADH dehydrogenase subunit 2 [Leptomastidea bifasciata]
MYLYYYYFSLPLILISNFMIMFIKSFFFMWMIMEINLISFISLILMNKFIYFEIIMNYFLIQTLNSHLFIMLNILINLNFLNKINIIFIFLSMLTKMGMPPFHQWYLKMMKFLNWMIFSINSSIQKIIPLFIINFYMFKNTKLFFNLSLYTILISSFIPFLSINTNSLKMIMCFSSFIQLAWMMLIMFINEFFWILMFITYNFISISIYYFLFLFNINYLNNLNSMNFNKFKNLYNFMFMFFSLASLPPFSGFMIKILFNNIMFKFLNLMILMILMILSLLNLFYYMRILNLTIMMFYTNNNMNFKFINFKNKKYSKLIYMFIITFMYITMYELI